ncbi:MAG: LexA family protein [Candidatus Kryptoniota bacterium]
MDKLTKRQQMVLNFISRHLLKKGYPPTIREIAENLGVRWTRGIERHLLALEKKGYINRARDKSRGITLSTGMTGIAVPIMGKPIKQKGRGGQYMVLDYSIVRDRKSYLVRIDRVDGVDLGIAKGDYVLVGAREVVKSGDIAAGLVAGEAVVYRVLSGESLSGGIEANKEKEASGTGGELLGKVKAVIRLLS